MVLFKRILFSREIDKDVRHNFVEWLTIKKSYFATASWGLKKGDWWTKKDEKKAKFLWFRWNYKDDGYRRWGIFIGRLALVIQTKRRV
jgi:hypothetical protein